MMNDAKWKDSKYGPLIGAIDEGTSSCRFMVFSSKTEEVIAQHQIMIKFFYPNQGWVEHCPMQILDAVVGTLQEVVTKMKAKNINIADIIAIGITNQRETTVLWDKKTGKPLNKAIVWMDNRTVETINKLLETKPNKDKRQLVQKCGLPISAYFSALKYRWLIDNLTEVKKAIQEKRCLFGTIDTWIVWKMEKNSSQIFATLAGGPNGGLHVTDVTNASRTMLMNLDTCQWDPELLQFFDIPVETLPEIRSSSEIYGKLVCTTLEGVPIAGILGDQQSALVGEMCFEKGQSKVTYGTGCFLLQNTGTKKLFSENGLLTTVGYRFGKEETYYALEGSIAVGGATFSWIKDKMKMIESFDEIEKLAGEVPHTRELYFVPAFQGLYAPYWEPNAKGVICGLSMETDRRHILRAALEALAFQTKELIEALNKDTKLSTKKMQVDGGMTVNKLFLQFLADICDIEITRKNISECTAFGAAIAAARAEGIRAWDVEKLVTSFEHYKSTLSEEERKAKYVRWKTAIQCSLGWTKGF